MAALDFDAIYREHYGRILATVIHLIGGDFAVAEDAVHDAFAAAMLQWPSQGAPANPRAWLVSTARHKAIDRLRRQSRREELAFLLRLEGDQPADTNGDMDERLRLIFTRRSLSTRR